MFSFEHLFFPDTEKTTLLDFYDGVLAGFLAALVRNGQLMSQHWNMIEENSIIHLFCLAPEEDSLEAKYYNEYCKRDLSLINNLSLNEPEYRLLGHTLGLSDTCTCQQPSFYILFTTFLTGYSPVCCGDCNLLVPLYKLPLMKEEKEYNSLIHWQALYESCDALFISSDVGERFGYCQISNIGSSLSKEGLRICKDMSAMMQKPFYYFLHKYYGKQRNNCPICGQSWKLDSALHGLYTYKCDKCGILSDGSHNKAFPETLSR